LKVFVFWATDGIANSISNNVMIVFIWHEKEKLWQRYKLFFISQREWCFLWIYFAVWGILFTFVLGFYIIDI
jgi:hypothetical protein